MRTTGALLIAMTGLTLVVGCKRESDLKITETVTEVFEQVPTNEVDILWVVDDSVSMSEEQERVTAGAQSFIENLDASAFDLHLGVITTQVDSEHAGELIGDPAYLTSADPDLVEQFQERVAVGAVSDNQLESGLEASILAVTAPLVDGANAGFLRESARLSIIVLSDEDDCSDFGALPDDADTFDCYADAAPLTPVDELVGMLREAKGVDERSALVQISGIIGPPVDQNCPAAAPGDRYAEAIELVGGLEANICETDYAGIMDALGLVARSEQTVFNLAYVAEPTSIRVQVTEADGTAWEVTESESDGWTYTSGTNLSRITFFGSGIPPRGSTFTVTYNLVASGSDATPVYE